MKRKLIKQANAAYTLTLPIEWIRKNKLSGKSEVEVSISEKSLIISTDSGVHGGSAVIQADGLTRRTLYTQLSAAYARGVDEIKIISKKDISSELTKSLTSTMGFAIISQKDDTYLIKDISGGVYSDLDEIFKRVFQVILLFYEAAINDVFGTQEETIEGLQARDTEVNKFCLYLQRAINRMSYADPINGRILFTYSFALEKISDEIERLWRTNIKQKVKKSTAIRELMEISKESFSKSFELYYSFNPKKIDAIYAIRENVREKSLSLLNLDSSTSRFIRHVVKIAEDSADLTHLTSMRRFS
ncbi:MAG TPA: hypothetical protein VKE88_01010 [Candidatus Nanoarchaeia archaeon]|nr:hypothetical protein [Candidatus Nanoarchaeia archaeon]